LATPPHPHFHMIELYRKMSREFVNHLYRQCLT
jgi:hypothetical protein